jgi:hypothetical protein
MKAFRKIILLVCLVTASSIFAQGKTDSLGLPGDNFDLAGALELFKKSDTPEAFEKAINSSDNEVNNLDLNADGKVDYVKVIDNKDGDSHTMVLQVAVTKSETQDVAVIEIEKTKDGNAHVQIVGDEELYGKDHILEPKDASAVSSEKIKKDVETDDVYKGKNDNNTNTQTNEYVANPNVVVNVWPWPAVQYMYSPGYMVWVSPWYWGYYPGWWNPWMPVYWQTHYWRAHRYHNYYCRANFYRSPNVHKGYYGRRMSSDVVRENQRTGYYAQKQISYKANVQPGKKYNAMPANPEKVFNKRSQENPKDINGNPKQINTQQKQESQPVRTKQEQIYTQPKKENTQPARRQQQQMPAPKNQGINMPQNNPPRQQGGGINQGGGGGGRNTGGGGGGRRK